MNIKNFYGYPNVDKKIIIKTILSWLSQDWL